MDVPNPARADRPTEKQIAFANKLLGQLGLPERTEAEWAANGQTRRSISELINDLLIDVKALPNNTSQSRGHQLQAADYPDVTAGFYAVPSLTGNNDLDFFTVQVPAEGTWKGCLFVKRVLGGHDPERVQQATAKAWLAVLMEHPSYPTSAKQLFGQEMGRCGECGRSLTDETSRARGIGPDCAAKYFA